MIGFFTVITFFNILFERKSVTNKVKKEKKKKNQKKCNKKIQVYQELHQCQKAVPRGRKWRVGGDMFCFMNGDDFSIPVEQPHFVLVDAASISLCLAFLSVTNQFYATLGFFGMGCQTNLPPEAGRLVQVLDENNRNCGQIPVSLVSYCLIHISTAPGLLII